MGLSDEVRSELAAIAPERGCCRLAEISALFHSAGSVHLRGRGRVALHLDVSTSAVARRAFSLLRQLGIHSEIRTYRRRSFDHATRYQLHISGNDAALGSLVEAGVLDARHAPLERPPKRVVGRACCRGAYVRGALLGGGSLSGPRSAHLELRTTSLEGAEFLRSVARRRRRQPRRARPRPPRSRVREGARRDRVRAHARGSDRRRPRVRGVVDRRGSARGGEPARECGSRKPRPHEPRSPGATRSRASLAARRHARAPARSTARDRPPPSALSPAAAARARGEMRPPDHQGICPSPPEESCRTSRPETEPGRRSRPFRGLGANRDRHSAIPVHDCALEVAAGRRGSSEDDLPLRVPCSGAGAERGLNSTTDEREPAVSRLRHCRSCVTSHSFSTEATGATPRTADR